MEMDRPPGAERREISRGRVLVVEDDASNRELLDEALTGEGCEVRTAANGLEALTILQDWQPALILLDLHLPVMDGEEFAARYSETPGPHAPVLLLTAAFDSADSAERLGAVGSLEKPFDLDQLLEVVAQYSPCDES